jgi:hypothetical protein
MLICRHFVIFWRLGKQKIFVTVKEKEASLGKNGKNFKSKEITDFTVFLYFQAV